MNGDQQNTPGDAGEGFWRFSLAFYARPGVAAALLALQDSAGCNVNLILFALWLGAVRGEPLDAAGLAAAKAVIGPLDARVIAPLRRLRRRLKGSADGDVESVRRRIAALEIGAERQAQYRLAGCRAATVDAAPAGDRLAAAMANLASCLGDADRSAEADLLRRTLAAMMRRG
ncbi:MAG TPA: TIGR02444 family protein [Stellaceae bacterium]|nr:TIGR02444 family protein [Stellaceae bacterium]